MNNEKIINLNPVFVNPVLEKNFLNFNSIFLYIFLIFEIIIIVSICYYFFKIEILFIISKLLQKEKFLPEEKQKYNTFMESIKDIIKIKKECKFITEDVMINKNLKTNNKYFLIYNDDKFMEALNDDKLFFEKKEDCEKFL